MYVGPCTLAEAGCQDTTLYGCWLWILSFFFPPVAVFLERGCGKSGLHCLASHEETLIQTITPRLGAGDRRLAVPPWVVAGHDFRFVEFQRTLYGCSSYL